VRGSRRSFATRPCRDAPDASRSRQAPVRTSGGAFNPTRRSGLWRILNSVGWIGSLAGALALWTVCFFQPTRRWRPDSHPGSLRDGAQTLLSVDERPKANPSPVRSAALRREEGGSTGRQVVTKDARPPTPAVYRTDEPVREATGAGRLAPPAGGNRPRTTQATPAILAFAKLPWVHRSSTKRTEALVNPTLTRTMASLKELHHARNKKVKRAQKFL